MNSENAKLSLERARAVAAQLTESGITHLVASPGFRNSPLLLAARYVEGLQVLSVVDERGAAFLALGLTKGGKRAAIVCTSGTAVANYFPAVMEAYLSHCPLLVITADRPLELVGSGANQCTDQVRVFGSHVRHFVDIDASWQEAAAGNHARYALAKAAAMSLSPIPGPVHVNIRFREPFLPSASEAKIVLDAKGVRPAPWKILPSAMGPSKEQWEAVENLLRSAQRPLFLVGPSGFSGEQLKEMRRISEKTGIPFLAEKSSGLPFTEGSYGGYVTGEAEPLLAAMAAGELPPPDLIVRFGAPLTGKALGLLQASHSVPQLVFDEGGESRDPMLHPSIFVQGGLEGWMRAILQSNLHMQDTDWRDTLIQKGVSHEKALSSYLQDCPLSEWLIHSLLGSKIKEGSALFLGNSMPIRDFNMAFQGGGKLLSVFTNRGLSGIDGLIASSAGVSLGTGSDTHAVIGDLSFLHDLSSLSILSSLKNDLRLTLWVMNNGGGEIFRTVQTARSLGEIEWFTTPQQFDLSALAKAFQIPFLRICTREEIESLDAEACSGPGVRLIEFIPDREGNLLVRKGFRFEG